MVTLVLCDFGTECTMCETYTRWRIEGSREEDVHICSDECLKLADEFGMLDAVTSRRGSSPDRLESGS
jgi:hypothetical protein